MNEYLNFMAQVLFRNNFSTYFSTKNVSGYFYWSALQDCLNPYVENYLNQKTIKLS